MNEAIVWNRPGDKVEVTLRSVPIPTPSPTQVLIRVVVSGSNPKDWKVPAVMESQNGTNTGDDIAGVVHAVGSDVTQFAPGQRVAAFHEMMTPGGSFAEYALSEEHCTFMLPKHISFEEGATIPLAAMTAVMGLFRCLALPAPWTRQGADRAAASGGVLVYGGASAVGAYAIKLLRKSGVHPIYAVAGRGIPFVEGLLDKSKGDAVVDYRNGDDAVANGLKEALGGRKLRHAFDAVSERGSHLNILKVLEADGKLTTILPWNSYEGVPETVDHTIMMVGDAHAEEGRELSAGWFRLFTMGLKEGWLAPHPHDVVPGGLGGIQTGLSDLKEGKASAVKYVFRIAETVEGL